MMKPAPAPTLHVASERWPIAGAFTISRGSKTEAEVVVAEVRTLR
jgi:L-Ala-D/L-Glu epimerase